jgi:hypothetical protein
MLSSMSKRSGSPGRICQKMTLWNSPPSIKFKFHTKHKDMKTLSEETILEYYNLVTYD